MPPRKPTLDRSRYRLWETDPGVIRLADAPCKWIAAIFDNHPPFHTLNLSFIEGRDFSGISGLTFLEAIESFPWKHPDFEPLRPLKRLKRAELNIYGKAHDLSPFAELQHLEKLRILPTSVEFDLAPLAACRSLKVIEFSNVTPENKPTFRSLAPLVGMTWLEELSLSGPLTHDDCFTAAKMPWLKELNLADTEPIEHYARLAAQMPSTQSFLFYPHIEMPFACDRCDSPKVRLTGHARPKLLCPKCNAKAVRAHEDRFNAANARAIGSSPP